MRRIIFAIVLVLLISSISLAQSAFENSECPMEVPEGVQVDCGYLTVPEDRDLPDGNQIRLAVAIVRAIDPNPEPDPILYLEGGPGASALISLDSWINTALRDNRDIVLIDQRGTGYSEPALVCDEGSGDEVESTRQCADELSAQGINLTAYTSRENAADIADLMRSLEYPTDNLYGISYGTRLALTVMRDHPEGIRSVVIDAVYPPQVAGLDEQAPNAYAAFSAMFNRCATDSYCNEAFPDLEARFYALLDVAYDNPFEIDGESYSDYEIIMKIFDSMYDSSVIPYLPAVIDSLANGDTALFTQLVNGELSVDPTGYYYDEYADYYGDDTYYEGYGYGASGGVQDLLATFDLLFMDYLGYEDYDEYLDALSIMDYDVFVSEVIPFIQEEVSDDDLLDMLTMFLEVETTDEALNILDDMTDDDYTQMLDDFINLLFSGGTDYGDYYYDAYDYGEGDAMVSEDADGMFNSVECYEEVPFNSLERAEELAQGLPPRLIDTFIGDMEIFIEICAVWQVDAPDPIETQAVVSDIPTLVLSGELDPITPPAWGDAAAENLSRAYAFTYPGAGHGVIDAGECAVQIINNFLDAPENAPDASCLEDVQVEFITQP